jgi:hypothetical protein
MPLGTPTAASARRISVGPSKGPDDHLFAAFMSPPPARRRFRAGFSPLNSKKIARPERDSLAFCAHAFVFLQLAEQIDVELPRFRRKFSDRLRSSSEAEERLLLGVPLLATTFARS